MDFDLQRKGSFTSGFGRLCQISSKLVQNCDRESTDRQTDRRTDKHRDTYTHRDHTSDLIICPMLCYSNGTDKKRTLSTALLLWKFRYLERADYTRSEVLSGISRFLGAARAPIIRRWKTLWRFIVSVRKRSLTPVSN